MTRSALVATAAVALAILWAGPAQAGIYNYTGANNFYYDPIDNSNGALSNGTSDAWDGWMYLCLATGSFSGAGCGGGSQYNASGPSQELGNRQTIMGVHAMYGWRGAGTHRER